MKNITSDTRAIGLRLLADGEATMAEVAVLAGVSRQAVFKWVQEAGFNPLTNRMAHLVDRWERTRRKTARP